jgi:hypothetical protein
MLPHSICKELRSSVYFDAYIQQLIRFKKIGANVAYAEFAKSITRDCLRIDPLGNMSVVNCIEYVLKKNIKGNKI